MGRYIVKLNDGARDYYLEWSTVVDAPVTIGMSLEAFKEYYRQQYGEEGMRDLDNRIARVEQKGTSAFLYDSADGVITGNRAGKRETRLTKEQLIDTYCVNTSWAESEQECPIEGTDPNKDR